MHHASHLRRKYTKKKPGIQIDTPVSSTVFN